MAKRRLGIIGSGSWASFWARSLKQSQIAELAAVAGGSRAPRYAEQFGLRLHGSPHELCDADDIEAVIIAAHHDSHRDYAVMAARAGKHVLVEKPMAMTPRQCDDMIAAASSAGVKLMVGHSRRYFPLVRLAKKMIDDGAIGRIRMLRQTFCWDVREIYKPGTNHWIASADEGGGWFLGYGCHLLDATLFLMGTRVRTVAGQFHPYWTDAPTENAGSMFLVFENGAHSQLWSLCAAPPNVGQWPPFPDMPEEESCIVGDRGLMILRPYEYLKVRTDGGWETVQQLPKEEADPVLTFLHQEAEDLLKAVDSNQEPTVTGEQGKHTVAAICAAYESSRTGMAVNLG